MAADRGEGIWLPSLPWLPYMVPTPMNYKNKIRPPFPNYLDKRTIIKEFDMALIKSI